MTTYLAALHPGQPGEKVYNPRKPLPYPIFVGTDLRCENVPGYALAHSETPRDEMPTLVGFQPSVSEQFVALSVEDWMEGSDEREAVGMVPVFAAPDGAMFSLDVDLTDAVMHKVASR